MTELPEVVYTPEPALRHPGKLLAAMWRDLRASRELAWRLFVRDTSARYRQTVLGYLWAFLPPLVTTFTFVFLRSNGVVKVGDIGIPYPAYVMIGTLLWQTFVDALQSPVKTATASKAMLIKINFPREAILLAGLGGVIFNFLIRLTLLVAVFVWFRITPDLTVLLVPVGVGALIVLGFMMGVLLVPLSMLYKDIEQVLIVGTTLWMFLTPVVYPLPTTGRAALLGKWNPVSPLITVTRDWLTGGDSQQLPGFLLVFGVSVLLLFGGWVVYRISLPIVIERMGG